MTRGLALVIAAKLLAGPAHAAPPGPVERAEALAAAATAQLPAGAAGALSQARQALALTADFEPTAFVSAGRKGEVVEDAYVAAREEYRHHRARLYEAVGRALLAQEQPAAAGRYLRRAVLLQATPARHTELARALLAQGRGREAMASIEPALAAPAIGPDVLAGLGQAVDLVGLPSAQAEIDRVRVKALGAAAEWRDGPVPLPAGLKLSTNPVFQLQDAATNVVYVAETSCRSCSEDMAALRKAVPAEARVLLVPERDDQDQALRQVVDLYRYGWSLLLGKQLAQTLALAPRSALVIAREGWSAAVVKPPFTTSLPPLVALLAKADLKETLPRAKWNHRPVARAAVPAPPAFTPEGLAPPEEDPVPAAFTAALEAFRAKRYAEALRKIDALEAAGDGYLLPPEARLNRALCVAGLGRREEARKSLLKVGDSRFQDEVDRALESVGTPAGRAR
jgi:tetratricopeptide (TPR) repeat protein